MEDFGSKYAGAYDALYQDKDYKAECDLIEKLIKSYCRTKGKTILDVGCGTGSHAIELAKRGYKVTGIDISRPMLVEASKKSKDIDFIQMDAREMALKGEFDIVIMMFAVLGYSNWNEDVESVLKNIKDHLKPGGLLIADVWYGPAVLSQKPSDRIKIVKKDGRQIIRVAKGELQTEDDRCLVSYNIWEIEDKKVILYTEESHSMRYFFRPELEMFLKSAGFIVKAIRGFPDVDKIPDETTWNIFFAARRPVI